MAPETLFSSTSCSTYVSFIIVILDLTGVLFHAWDFLGVMRSF